MRKDSVLIINCANSQADPPLLVFLHLTTAPDARFHVTAKIKSQQKLRSLRKSVNIQCIEHNAAQSISGNELRNYFLQCNRCFFLFPDLRKNYSLLSSFAYNPCKKIVCRKKSFTSSHFYSMCCRLI